MASKRLIWALILATATPTTMAAAQAQSGAQDWQLLFKGYPPEALARGEQGVVGFKLKLDQDGNPTSCEVTQSSGYASLDGQTCRLILDHAEFKGVRDTSGNKVSAQYVGAVNWKLPNGQAAPAPAKTTMASADDPNKLICKRQLKTGTLASYERLCYTKAQWETLRDQTRREWGDDQVSRGSQSGH